MRLLLLLTAVGLATSASAQDYALDRGSYLLAAAASYTSLGGDLYATSEQSRFSAWGFAPKVEYFLLERIGVGVFVERGRVSYGDDGETRTWTVGPSVAYYFGRPGGAVYPFVSAGIGYSRATVELPDPDNPSITQEAVQTPGLAGLVSGGAVVEIRAPFYGSAEAVYQFAGYDTDEFGSLDANKFGVRLGVAYFLF